MTAQEWIESINLFRMLNKINQFLNYVSFTADKMLLDIKLTAKKKTKIILETKWKHKEKQRKKNVCATESKKLFILELYFPCTKNRLSLIISVLYKLLILGFLVKNSLFCLRHYSDFSSI